MKKIIAKKKKGYLIDGEDLIPHSRSEENYSYIIPAEWKYDIPENYEFRKEFCKFSESIPIVTPDEKILGYAVRIWYVLAGKIYKTAQEAYLSGNFHPNDIESGTPDEIPTFVKRQKKAIKFGYYGDE